jgi:allantoinase
MSSLLAFSGRRVLLPDTDSPRPATIIIDLSSGKILSVLPVRLSKNDLTPHIAPDSHIATYVDAGDKVVLPGLVE